MAQDTYFNLKTNLLSSNINIKNEGNVHYNVTLEDIVEVVEIVEKEIVMKITRNLKFVPGADMHLAVTYIATLQTKYNVTKDEFESDIKQGMPILNNVFSRIALVIGELTNQTILGPILTIPAYNMKEIVLKNKKVLTIANEALRENGFVPCYEPIRGGTDGARLTFGGIVTPNLGTGGQNFHGPFEYLDVTEASLMVNVVKSLVQKYK